MTSILKMFGVQSWSITQKGSLISFLFEWVIRRTFIQFGNNIWCQKSRDIYRIQGLLSLPLISWIFYFYFSMEFFKTYLWTWVYMIIHRLNHCFCGACNIWIHFRWSCDNDCFQFRAIFFILGHQKVDVAWSKKRKRKVNCLSTI